jgi:acetylornithine/succinyldiaminopimelate/putrescine aminotransferase
MAAIRLARAATGRLAVIRMERSYHGHAEIEPAAEVPFNDAGALERRIEEVRPACVLMEGAMTSGGLTPPEPGYLEAVRELTSRHGVVLVFDEVKTGLTIAAGGAVERFGVTPDLVTLAKALGGGLPIGAMLASENCAGALQPGYHGSTFGGNPVATAAALAAFELLASAEVQTSAQALSSYFVPQLEQYGKVQGRGLMLGVELAEGIDAKQIVVDLLTEKRVIANATGESTLRFLPPLIATTEHADRALESLAEVFPR